MEPNGGENEEKFDEDRAERQHATHDDREGWLHIPNLLGHLPRYLVDPDREIDVLAAVAEIGTEENQWDGNSKPEHKQREHGSKWHSA